VSGLVTGLATRFAAARAAGPRLSIRRGALSDYDALAFLHYRAGRPATADLVLIAEHAGGVVGVLVVSHPTLNARWRERAWPGRFRSGDRRADAVRLNREVRTISRVVVDPRWRGLGVATRLVRAYLASPLTPLTEAAAAMGAVCPFFRAAGMTEWRPGPSAREVRLLRCLRRAGVTPPELADLPASRLSRLAPALRTWADASRATRRLKRGPLRETARHAAASLLGPRVAYTFEVSGRARRRLRGRASRRRCRGGRSRSGCSGRRGGGGGGGVG
jgi:GNAT superfamily N-acetyltransferase